MAMTGTQASSIELQEVGSFPAEKPAFLSLNQGKEGTDLYITTFKALGSDGVRRVENVGSLLNTQIADIRADLLSRKITWPNGMKPVPAEIFGDNYFAAASLGATTTRMEEEYSLDADSNTDVETTGAAFSIGLGKFIPVRDNWYLTPQVSYSTGSADTDDLEISNRGIGMSIGFGARF